MNLFNHINTGATEERGDEAKKTLLAGVSLIGDIIKTTLGPSGMLKTLVNENKIMVTNDGATILKNLRIDSATAKMLINASVGQDSYEGDGTTSVAVLAALLIEQASRLDIPPLKIVRGFQLALEKSLLVLDSCARICEKEDLSRLCRTTLSSKVLKNDLFVKIAVGAIERLGDKTDLNLIHLIKCPGRLEESYLDDGFILKSDTKIELENPRVLVANTALDADKIKIFGAKVSVQSVGELARIEQAEKERMKEKVNQICKVGIDCFINRQLIYDFPSQLFEKNGVIPIEHADFDGVERLSNVLGGRIMSSFGNLTEDCLGSCDKIFNIEIGSERMVKFSGLKEGACTIVLRGSSKEILDEAERSLHDALCVLNRIRSDMRIVYGGGCIEMAISLELSKYAMAVTGKESDAVIAFANALQQIPCILASNSGLDGEDIRAKLRAAHAEGKSSFGVDFSNGGIGCMNNRGVIESVRIKKRVLLAACEVAQMIIKCDGLIKCKPRERTRM
ncbi:T-complex protein 1 subunit beta [Astathelohania contejeani]|uniref:CCT-beta n=1 Tax=Astathelohania contejeani TaxID=164912 RepID=A0ABQ7HY50_9MICR|nr:T-complex protein 1 subunit beta [Thelohania contejeani]